MPVEHIIAALVVLILITLVAHPLSRWIRLPFTSTLVAMGFGVSELIVFLGYDTGIRAGNYQSLVFYVFIPILVFDAACRIDKQLLLTYLLPVLYLAVIGMLATCLLVAALVFYGIDHASGFPWIAALITGAILAATDPAAVVARLQQLKAPPSMSVMLEGESLLNDAAAIVLFAVFMTIALQPAQHHDMSVAVVEFCKVFAGGALVGVVLGYMVAFIERRVDHRVMTGLLGIVLAYGAYLVAEKLGVSGVMASLLAGIMVALPGGTRDTANDRHALVETLAFIANAFVFIIVGAVITVAMFEERWLAMLIAIVAVLLARVLVTLGGLSLLNALLREPVDVKQQLVIAWGGLRGAVTLALALALPTELDYWWTIQSIAFGVVVFTLFVQAPSMRLLLDGLRIRHE